MHPDDPLPFSLDSLSRRALVGEVIMQPDITHLLREAEERGFATMPARGACLQYQIERLAQFLHAV